ncbi:response regulator [Ancylomarina longa]|uniref:histidine kinase n=1 Tax=Ancylomarina longa TaxID=2487017 RepID=A0A434AUE3_9BACT|nr:response regulator [Ancylomarina longa]RUT77956.1 response regulator [Ancylomarina longa]
MQIPIRKLADWSIKSKLLLLTFITISSIFILSFTSSYFFNTSRTLSIMINAVRVHQKLLQNAFEDLYYYKIHEDPEYITSSAKNLDLANQMIKDLLKLRNDYSSKSDEEIATYLYDGYPEIYNHEFNNALLLVSRLRILDKLGNEEMQSSRKLVIETLDAVDQIKKELITSNEEIDINKTQVQLLQIQKYYSNISSEVNNLAHKTNSILVWVMIVITLILGILILLLARYISLSITVPVNKMVANFKIIAKGNFNTPLLIPTKDEIGALASSFNIIQQDFQNIVNNTQNIAKGDLSVILEPKSNHDELALSLNQMVQNLKDSKSKNDLTIWFRSGVNQLNDLLQGDQDITQVSKNTLDFLSDFLSAELAAIYVYEEEKEILSLSAAIGIPSKNQFKTIQKGHGLVGHVAETKQWKNIKNIPKDYFEVFSGTGEMKPQNIVIVPLIYNDILWGVLELASIQIFEEYLLEFIKTVQESITVKIASSIARNKLENLLEKTQNQASELQVQQEELRVANEELAEQTKILIESEKKLQVQQEELRVANEELEERTNQLEHQKNEIENQNQHLSKAHNNLEDKARELEQASQYKSDFLANMSHELRTPLNSLLILSGLLSKNKKGNLNKEDIESIEIIHKSGKDLLQLINEILDLSKIEAGKMSIQIESVKSEDIKSEILQDFTHHAQKKKLDFSVQISEDFPPTIETDSLRINQIIKNLLSNAFKFTSRGSVAVRMEKTADRLNFWREELKGLETCTITVSDTGVGIPADKKDAIFEAFQQADGSTSRQYGGTGLGLSISKELARMLGGEIHLESKVGEGSIFTLIIPVHQEKIVESPIKIEVRSNELESPVNLPFFITDDRDIPHLPNSLVLIIHSNINEAKSLYHKVHESNFKAIVASSINDAIILIEAHHPTSIIVGMEFLMQNGKQSLDNLRNHPFASKLPIHIVNPVEGIREHDTNKLPTVDATDLTRAIDKIKNQLFLASKKILVVEDNSSTRKVIKSLLIPTNVIIEEASTGEDAIAMIKSNLYDCVILDLGLPDISGYEVLDKLKASNIKIPNTIIYTGSELSREEHRKLSKFTNSIILKGLKSDERLMDEVSLFLHQVATQIPDNPKINVTELDDSIFKGKKVLVVDDEIRNIFALGKILEDKDIQVLEAENGKIAIDVLKENQNIDLVLMDIMMPEMDGYEAMDIIRKTPKINEVPIICLTAKAMKEDYQKAIASGANDYLTKPIDENKLFSMLKIWLYN